MQVPPVRPCLDPAQARGSRDVSEVSQPTVESTKSEEMIRTFKYPLEPNLAQAAILSNWIEHCRQLYNAALEQRRDTYKRQRITLTLYDQHKQLTELRAAMPEWREIPVEAERSALRRLGKAFDAFFRRVKAGQKPGYPRFRGRDRFDSFDLPTLTVDGNRVQLPKLGLVKFHLYREMKGKILSVTVRRSVSRWWISFACDIGAAPEKRPVKTAVGIDLGLTTFAVLSNGDEVPNPRFLCRGEEVLARRQRALATKTRGSRSRQRAKILISKAHEHIHNQRLDFARKLACETFARFDLVAHEDLNIKGMVHGNLAKSIHDASWGMFIGALQSKAECAGKWCVPVDPRGTSIRCSECGRDVQKTLSEREHACPCGARMSRDLNAAINVFKLGMAGRAVVGSGSPPGRSPTS